MTEAASRFIDYTYRYSFSSQLQEESGNGRLSLATSGGIAEFPYFFEGYVLKPRLTATLLNTVAKLVSTRFTCRQICSPKF